MTTLYRPVLISSAEQAEALPIGTLARHDDHMPVEKWRDEDGGTHWGYIEESVKADLLLGWTALVPVEAKEEATHEMRTCRGVENFAPSYGIFQVPSRRLVTPWEEA